MIGCVRFKVGVFPIGTLAPAGARLLSALDAIARGFGLDLLVTCVDREHPLADPHSRGEALDVSVLAWPTDRIVAVHEALTLELGPAFTVLYETPVDPGDPQLRDIAFVNVHASAPHLHLQLRKGTAVYPSVTPPSDTRSA